MYVGVTNNLENRVAEHRSGKGGAFTRRYRVHALVHAEEYQYVEDVIAREKGSKAGAALRRTRWLKHEPKLGRLA